MTLLQSAVHLHAPKLGSLAAGMNENTVQVAGAQRLCPKRVVVLFTLRHSQFENAGSIRLPLVTIPAWLRRLGLGKDRANETRCPENTPRVAEPR